MVIIKEKFEDLDPDECNYLPWGPDLKSCVEYCKNPSKELKDVYKMSFRDNANYCNTEKCINLCNECDDIDRCQWINPFLKDVNSYYTNFNPELKLTEVTSEIKSIYLTKYNSKEVNIEWEDKYRSKNYMIHYVEGTQMNNNVKIIFTDLNFFKFSLIENDENDENIPFLNSGSKYLFKVYGLNTDKPNTESNILPVYTPKPI